MTPNKDHSYQYEFFETTEVSDFRLHKASPSPEGYPVKPKPDRYVGRPSRVPAEDLQRAFFDHVLKNPAPGGIKGYYYELVRLYLGKGPVHEDLIMQALVYIEERRDCADFVLLGIIRMLYQLADSPLMTPWLLERAREVVLGFKYWPDEPGIDSMCSWTENHHIMFSCSEYLAGQLYPEYVFTNSALTGIEKMKRAGKRIRSWLALRYRTGFSEWLSHVYYDEDITALVNLIDFCADEHIVRQAETVLDLVFYDMALNSFRGSFVSSHGRSYTREKQNALYEATMDTQKLMFGMGRFSGADNMSAAVLAMSPRYRLPKVIRSIAEDTERPEMINRQRMSIRLEETARWGLSLKNPDDVMSLLCLEAYAHPLTFRRVLNLFDRFRWWDNQFFSIFTKKKRLITFLKMTGLTALVTRIFEKDMTRNTREEVDVCTYRTPDYMMSSALDYRAGYGGDQQHIWQVSFGPEAVCFTTHPGGEGDASPGYWVGNGSLPRVAQYRNTLIAVYRISRKPGIYLTNRLYFTHAWLPRDRFDEVVEKNGWIFARSGKGYLALYSTAGFRWQTTGVYAGMEVIAEGTRNTWICEAGREAVDGSFGRFIERTAQSHLAMGRGRVIYESPANGRVEFGWKGPFICRGRPVDLHPAVRYENPYGRTPFDAPEISVRHGDEWFTLNFGEEIRRTSGLDL